MPIYVKSLDNGIGVDFVAEGIVTGQELIDASAKIFFSEEKVRGNRYGILDFTKAEFLNASSEELKSVTQLDKKAASINPDIIIALVSEKSRVRGLTQIWKAYMDETDWETMTFSSRNEAVKWIIRRSKEKFGIKVTVS